MKSLRNQSSSGEPSLPTNVWLWVGPEVSHFLPACSILKACQFRIRRHRTFADKPLRLLFPFNLDAELFRTVTEARVVIAAWRHRYNHERPHSALGYHPSATAYGSPSSRESVSGGRSGSEPEKSIPTFDCEATITSQPNSEVGVNGGYSSRNEDKITWKTYHSKWPKNGGRSGVRRSFY